MRRIKSFTIEELYELVWAIPKYRLAGVPQQTTVLAFLFGNGHTNFITPTSGTLLAYLATARVGWGELAKFVFPLWVLFAVTSMILLSVAVMIGF